MHAEDSCSIQTFLRIHKELNKNNVYIINVKDTGEKGSFNFSFHISFPINHLPLKPIEKQNKEKKLPCQRRKPLTISVRLDFLKCVKISIFIKNANLDILEKISIRMCI